MAIMQARFWYESAQTILHMLKLVELELFTAVSFIEEHVQKPSLQ